MIVHPLFGIALSGVIIELAIQNGLIGSFTAGNSNIIQGGQFGGINEDPLFIDAINDDLRLQPDSPAIDAGLQTNLPADTQDLDGDEDTTEKIPFDLNGSPRVVGDEVDIGAFEFTTNRVPTVEDQTFTIPENSLLNTLVGTVTADDPDNDTLTFSITAGNPDQDEDGTAAFTIDNEGIIRVADPDDIDFETNPNNQLTVVANDGEINSQPATVTINLTNVDEGENNAPVANDATFTLAENSSNGTTVGTVTATDADGDNLTYSITAGNPNGDQDGTPAFAIDNTGTITVADSDDLDFETNPNNTLTVTVTDNGTPSLSDTATITVNLSDIEPETNLAPVADDATFTLAENSNFGTEVGTVSASDPDGDNLTYSITAGNPNNDNDATPAFSIDNTGKITVSDSDDIDFEINPGNTLTVTVTDDGTPSLSDTATITVNLTDVEPEGNNAPIVNNQNFTLKVDSIDRDRSRNRCRY